MGDTHATTKVRPGAGVTSALVLEGKSCGLLRKVSGGAICATVVAEEVRPGNLSKKHLASVGYEPFELELGFTMEAVVYDWIASTWKMGHPRHGGSILDCNDKLEVQSEREFANALLTETTIPKLDAGAKDPAWLRLKFAAETVRIKKGSGKASGPDPRNPEKAFVPSSFKLEIDGLDCEKVRGIESFTVEQKLVREDVGENRDGSGEPGVLVIPNLKIFFSEVMNESWAKWFEDFVIQGKGGTVGEKTGKLTLLSPNKQPLADIALSGLGPFELGIETDEDGQRRGMARLYCEAMEFKLGG